MSTYNDAWNFISKGIQLAMINIADIAEITSIKNQLDSGSESLLIKINSLRFKNNTQAQHVTNNTKTKNTKKPKKTKTKNGLSTLTPDEYALLAILYINKDKYVDVQQVTDNILGIHNSDHNTLLGPIREVLRQHSRLHHNIRDAYTIRRRSGESKNGIKIPRKHYTLQKSGPTLTAVRDILCDPRYINYQDYKKCSTINITTPVKTNLSHDELENAYKETIPVSKNPNQVLRKLKLVSNGQRVNHIKDVSQKYNIKFGSKLLAEPFFA